MKKIKYLVVGTGRCGTVYMARLLTSLGVTCGHECCFDWRGFDYAEAKLDGLIPMQTSDCSKNKFQDGSHFPIGKWLDESKIVAESSYMASPFLQHKLFNETKIIHVVRNPIRVINSFIKYLEYFANRHPALWYPAKKYESFIYYHCPDLYWDMSQEERAALYVLRWNKMIQKLSEGKERIFHRVEDDPQSVIDFVDMKRPESFFCDRKINSFEKTKDQFTLDKLPPGNIKDELIEMGREYGYSMGLESNQFLT
jgi:hypothetical protein